MLLVSISWLRRLTILFRVICQIIAVSILNQELGHYPRVTQNDALTNDAVLVVSAGTQLAAVCVIYAGILSISVCPTDDYDTHSAYHRFELF